MFSEEPRDLTAITDDSNVVGAYQYAMTKTSKDPVTGEYPTDSKDYILKSNGKVLKFLVSNSFKNCHINDETKITRILEELRHTSIDGKYYDLFSIKKVSNSDYSVKVMQKTVRSILESSSQFNGLLDMNITSFWETLKKSYDRNLLFRKSVNGQRVLANSKGPISIFIRLNIDFDKVDYFIKNKFKDILRDQINESGDTFIYNGLVFDFSPTSKGTNLDIYIQ